MTRETKALRDADDVRIDRDAFVFTKTRPQNDRCGLAADSLECIELRHRLRNLAVMLIDQSLAHFLDESGFVAIGAAGMDIVFELFARDADIVLGCLEFFVERLRDDVHSNIGTLGAQDGRDQEIERRAPVEERARGSVLLLKYTKHGSRRQR